MIVQGKGSGKGRSKSIPDYKTEWCQFVLRSHGCRWGDDCWYAHSPADKREKDPPADRPAADRPGYKTEMCIRVHSKGGCKWGAGCWYAHSPNELLIPAQPTRLPPGADLQPRVADPVPPAVADPVPPPGADPVPPAVADPVPPAGQPAAPASSDDQQKPNWADMQDVDQGARTRSASRRRRTIWQPGMEVLPGDTAQVLETALHNQKQRGRSVDPPRDADPRTKRKQRSRSQNKIIPSAASAPGDADRQQDHAVIPWVPADPHSGDRQEEEAPTKEEEAIADPEGGDRQEEEAPEEEAKEEEAVADHPSPDELLWRVCGWVCVDDVPDDLPRYARWGHTADPGWDLPVAPGAVTDEPADRQEAGEEMGLTEVADPAEVPDDREEQEVPADPADPAEPRSYEVVD